MTNLDQNKKQMIFKCLVWAGFIISLIALRQYFVGFDDTMKYMVQEKINDPYAVLILQRNRVFSPFVTPDVLAGYLIMILPLFILLRDRIFMAVPILLALMLTGSLGAMMSLLLASGIYFYANGKFSRKAIFGLAGFLLIVVAIYIYRHVHPDSQMRPGFSLEMRLNYWRDALVIIKDHLIAGVGLGNFNLDNSRYAHNSYLQIWAETGILGIVAFIWLLKTFLRSNKGITVLSIACVVFLIHNLIDFTFFLPEIVFIWWTLLGLNLGENEVPAKGSPLAPPLERR